MCAGEWMTGAGSHHMTSIGEAAWSAGKGTRRSQRKDCLRCRGAENSTWTSGLQDLAADPVDLGVLGCPQVRIGMSMSVHADPGARRAKESESAAHDVRAAAADPRRETPLSFQVNPSVVSTAVIRRSDGRADSLGGTPVAASTLEILRRRQGGGRALPEALVAPISEQLNVDLSNVRVQLPTPRQPRRLAPLQATAFTHGNDLYFAEGAYRPDSAAGKHLLAHELAHVRPRMRVPAAHRVRP